MRDDHHLRRPGSTVLRARLLGAAICALAIAGCNQGGGGGGAPGAQPVVFRTLSEAEPNDAADGATALPRELTGLGDLVAVGDIDRWDFEATAGEVLSIELFASGLDLGGWGATCNDVALEVIDPAGAPIARHSNALFAGIELDLDFPALAIGESGTHQVVVRAANAALAGGEYALRVRARDPLGPVQTEAEPWGDSGANDVAAIAEPVVPGTVWGYHVDGERDCFSFEVSEPSAIRLEVVGYRQGIAGSQSVYYDPYLFLRDEAGNSLIAVDDGFRYDPVIQYAATTPGTYVAEVHEYVGNAGSGEYVLTIEVAPLGTTAAPVGNHSIATAHPIAIGETIADAAQAGAVDHYAFEGRAGDLLRVHLFAGQNLEGPGAEADVSLIAPDGTTLIPLSYQPIGSLSRGFFYRGLLGVDGTHTIRVSTSGSDAPYRVRATVHRESSPETEPNGDIATASPFGRGERRTGGISELADVDLYRFSAEAGELVTFAAYAGPGMARVHFTEDIHGSTLSPRLRVLDGAGAVLSEATSGGCPNPERLTNGSATLEVSFVPPATGEYFLEVTTAATVSGRDLYVIEWVQ